MAEKVSNMKNLVTYQDGSIVSKEIIKKPTGTVTIFAFDQDQGLSEHTAPFDALVFILDGEAEIIISGELSTSMGMTGPEINVTVLRALALKASAISHNPLPHPTVFYP